MKEKTNTIIELEQAGRFSEAGYGRLFAYDSLHFNAKVDARTKAKYIRLLNPDTIKDTQIDILYSGPTVFFRSDVDIIDKYVDKLDLKSAYPAYLISDQIQKPGMAADDFQAEGINGADVRTVCKLALALQKCQSFGKLPTFQASGIIPSIRISGLFQFFLQFPSHIPCTFIGKCDHQDIAYRYMLLHDQAQNPGDQYSGLSRTG